MEELHKAYAHSLELENDSEDTAEKTFKDAMVEASDQGLSEEDAIKLANKNALSAALAGGMDAKQA